MAEESSRKDIEYWKETLHMFPHRRGAPYINDHVQYGEVTEKIPSNFPSGVKRHAASIVNVMISNKESSHSGLYWSSGRNLYFYNHIKGDIVEFFTIKECDGSLTRTELGIDTEHGHTYVYQPGTYGAFRMKDKSPDAYALFNIVVVPGYEDGDYTHHIVEEMKAKFPQHSKIIEELGKIE